jgi:membrane fusion protein, heavy metal efflux system
VDIPFVRVGQEIEVHIMALPNRPTRARITAIGASSDPGTRRIMVRSEIPNPDRILRAEMFATFKILVGEPQSIVGVPTAAVIREGTIARLWVESDQRLFRSRNVTLGPEQDGCIQVQDGLKAGEVVIGRGAIFVDNELRQ